MLPTFWTTEMEAAVDLLAENFRKIMVCSYFYNISVIRLRADHLKETRVFWLKTKTQIDTWEKKGGVALAWNESTPNTGLGITHDALFLTECPRSVELLDRKCHYTTGIVVIYRPPSWRLHEEALEHRMADKDEFFKSRVRLNLERMKWTLDQLPELTRERLEPLSRLSSLSSCAPE